MLQPINDKDSLFIYSNLELHLERRTKVALFDLDDTLIKYPTHTKINNKKHWSLLYSNIIYKLKDLNQQGYFIAILSNQLDLHPFLETFSYKLKVFLSQFDFPILFIGSLKYDLNRKPLPGMFFYVKNLIAEIKEGFYVGDAAGRPNDHSCCDIKFAYNCKLKFYTPDAFFQKKTNVTFIEYNIYDYKKIPVITKEQRIVLLFGRGRNSGKTHFSQSFFKKHLILRNNLHKKSFIIPEQTIFLNIKKKSEIFNILESNGKDNVAIYFLDYDHKIIHFLKTFSKFSHKKSLFDARDNEIHRSLVNKTEREEIQKWFFSNFGMPVNFIDFYFDDKNYTEYQKMICKYVL